MEMASVRVIMLYFPISFFLYVLQICCHSLKPINNGKRKFYHEKIKSVSQAAFEIRVNRTFSLWLHFTTTTRILLVSVFSC